MTPWLDRIAIEEYSELIERDRSTLAGPGQCGALPAKAFAHRYVLGCLRQTGHEGPHAATAVTAERLERAAHHRTRRR